MAVREVLRERPVAISSSVLAAVLLLTAGLVISHRLAPKHLLTVSQGVLYRSATLPPEQLAKVIERYSIRTVVNLRSAEENARDDWHQKQADLLARLAVRFIDLPMHSGYPPNDELLDRWLTILDDPSARPILVHCEHGVIRAGIMSTVFDLEYGRRSKEQAFAEFDVFGGRLKEPITTRVREFISGYERRLPLRQEPEALQLPALSGPAANGSAGEVKPGAL